MAFKNNYLWVLIFFLTPILVISCSEGKNIKADTFYIELVNFKNDSLKKQVADNIFGKVSYYKNNKLKIISSNYVTEDFPDMHAFQNVEVLDKNIEPGTRKVKVEFGRYYTADSIEYALQKYIYKKDKWVKTSDMGVIRSTNTYRRAREFAITEFAKKIIDNIVVYTYN